MRRLSGMFGGGSFTQKSSPRTPFLGSFPKPSPWARIAVIMVCLLILSAVKQITDNSGHIHREISERETIEYSKKAARLMKKHPPTPPPTAVMTTIETPLPSVTSRPKRSKVTAPFGTGTIGLGDTLSNSTSPPLPPDPLSTPVPEQDIDAGDAKPDILIHNSANLSESKNVSASLALANALLSESSDSGKFDV